MAYSHFGKQAEVWKHLPLCDILLNEKPSVYVETNSAYADYLLTKSPEQEYGIYHFINNAGKYPELINSAYYQIQYAAMNNGRYMGSSALAMSLLKSNTYRYILFDIDKDALESYNAFTGKLPYVMDVDTINEDSRIAVENILHQLPVNAFLHIDPYGIMEVAANGYNYLDLFIESANRGIKSLLWYGYHTLNEKRILNKYITEKISRASNQTFYGKELTMEIIEEHNVPCNPGIMGSGLLAANLCAESINAIETYSSLLVKLWRGSHYREFKGDLYPEDILL